MRDEGAHGKRREAKELYDGAVDGSASRDLKVMAIEVGQTGQSATEEQSGEKLVPGVCRKRASPREEHR